MSALFFNVAGFIGIWLMIVAYFLMNTGKWRDDEPRFHACNLIGALLVMVSLMHAWNLAVFVMECAWGSVAAYGLWQSLRRPKV